MVLDGRQQTDRGRWRRHAATLVTAALAFAAGLILAAVDLVRWYFRVPDGERSIWKVILWWEIRRIPYNIITGGLFVAGLAFWLVVVFALYPNTDEGDPQLWIVMPFVFNFLYTAGWIVELCIRPLLSLRWRRSVGPVLLSLGTVVSLLVAFIPTAAAVSLIIEAVLGWFV